MARGSSPDRDKRFFFLPEHPDRLWGAPSPPFHGYRSSFPRGITRRGRGVYHSLLSSAEAKNEWSYTSFLLYTFKACKEKNLLVIFIRI